MYDYQFLAHPKIISGKCALESIPAELSSHDSGKPLVVASRKTVQRGLHKTLVRAFRDSGYPLGGIYDEVRDYAGIGLAREAAELFRMRGCDSFLALGNSKAADVARAANVLVSEGTSTLYSFFRGAPLAQSPYPFLLVPACCLSGAEAANTLCLDNRHLVSESFYPDVVILDQGTTPACSRSCAAQSALLAMDNSLAAYLDPEYNPMKNAFAGASLDLVRQHLHPFLQRPRSKRHSLALVNAVVLSSIAAANAPPAITRILSEELEKITSINRVVFLGKLTPGALALAQEKNALPPEDLLLAVSGMEEYCATPQQERAGKGVERLLQLWESAVRAISEPAASRIPSYIMAEAWKNAQNRAETDMEEQEGLQILERVK